MKVRNKRNNLAYDLIAKGSYWIVEDDIGEIRKFKKEVMEYVSDDMNWEDVPIEDIRYNNEGKILIRVDRGRLYEMTWVYIPSEHVRMIERDDRSVIQRKKKG